MNHLPFAAGCSGGPADAQGNLPLSTVFRDPEQCDLVPAEEEELLGPWDVSFRPAAAARSTTCDYAVTCTYLHRPEYYVGKPYWTQLDAAGSVVFWLSRQQVNASEVTQSPSWWPETEEEWERFREQVDGHGLFRKVEEMLRFEQFVPVRVWVDCQRSDDLCSRRHGLHPRNITLSVKHWATGSAARSTRRDTLVSAWLILSDWAELNFEYDSPISSTWYAARPTYTFRVRYEHAAWLDLLNHFALGPGIYLSFYVFVGVCLVAIIWIVWAAVRCAVRLTASALHVGRKLPGLRLCLFLKLYLVPSFSAACVVFGAVLPFLMILKYVFIAYNPFNVLPCSYEFIGPGALPMTREENQRCLVGRMGLMFCTFGVHMLYDTIRLWVPAGSAPRHEVRSLRFSLACNTVGYLIMMVFSIQFSFSRIYKIQPLAFWGIFKIICIYQEMRIARTAGNAVYFPQVMLLEVASLIMTGWLGAGDFLSFINVQVLELAINTVRRITIEPLKGKVLHAQHVDGSVARATTQSDARAPSAAGLTEDGGESAAGLAPMASLPMPKEAAKAAFNQAPRMTLSASSSDEQTGEQDLPAGLRHTLIIWCTDTAALYIEALMVTMMFLFRNEFEVDRLFGRRTVDLLYFMYFLYFLIPASWVEDAFTNNINEVLYNWDTVSYMQRQAARYRKRRHLWALSAPAADERLHPWERIDRVLMTDQLWVILMLYGAGGAIAMLGYVLMLHQQYSFWVDPLTLLIVGMVSIFCRVFRSICLRIAKALIKPTSATGAAGTWRV